VTDLLSIAVLISGLHLAVPLIYPTIGGLICERSGVMNIGLEGMMLAGAFSGVATSWATGSAWAGMLAAVLAGCLSGTALAVLAVTLGGNQVVAATAINLVGAGLTAALVPVVWGADGSSPPVPRIEPVRVPLLADLPVVGRVFSELTLVDYGAAVLAVAAWWLLFRTEAGLRLRACGESPEAADAAGVPVNRTRFLAVVASGALAGVGGAYLSLVSVGLFQASMTQGRGYLALAALVFGKWRMWPAVGACLAFGVANAIGLRSQVDALGLPHELLLALPYVLALVALATFVGRASAPAAIGRPFTRT
jgi:general nucleoside transport system permease protein